MRSDVTDITLVVDRSGSMQQRREDAEAGANAFIQNRANESEKALLTLVHFDTEYEAPRRGVPIDHVSEYRLEPRGVTALLDAVKRATNETGIRLGQLKKARLLQTTAGVVTWGPLYRRSSRGCG